jgi:hypothetical protein
MGPSQDGLVNIYIPIADLNVKTAIRIGAYPCFIVNCCSLSPKIGQRNEHPHPALLTLRKTEILHDYLPTL